MRNEPLCLLGFFVAPTADGGLKTFGWRFPPFGRFSTPMCRRYERVIVSRARFRGPGLCREPARRRTSPAFRSSLSIPGSFGVAKAASSSGMNPAPPHSLYASSSTGFASSACDFPPFSRWNVTVPRTESARSSRNPPSTSRSRSLMESSPRGSIRSTDQRFSLTNAGLDRSTRTSSSTRCSAWEFSTWRLRRTGNALWCAAKFSFAQISAWIFSVASVSSGVLTFFYSSRA